MIIIKSVYKKIILVVVFVLIIGATFFYITAYNNMKYASAVPINTVRTQNKKAFVVADWLSEDFAYTQDEFGNVQNFHITSDGNKYLILVLDDNPGKSVITMIENTYLELANGEKLKFTGSTVKINDEIKDLTIDYLKDAFKDNIITESNFSEYVYTYMIDTERKVKSVSFIWWVLLGVECAFLVGYLVCISISAIRRKR